MKKYTISSIIKKENFTVSSKAKIILIFLFTFTMSLKAQQSGYQPYVSNFAGDTLYSEKAGVADSVKKHIYDTVPYSSDIDFYFLIGLSFDKDYSEYITKAFEAAGRTTSGFSGWVNLGVALQFKITNNFYLSPSITGRFSRIGITDPFTNATSTRYINALYSIALGSSFYIPA
ncbi:MAG: hypothetical protein ABI840_13265, partial [bacterium]